MKTTIRKFAEYLLTQVPADAEIESASEIKDLYERWSLKEKAELYNKLKVDLTAAGLLGTKAVIQTPKVNPFMTSNGSFERVLNETESSAIKFMKYSPLENTLLVEYRNGSIPYKYSLNGQSVKQHVMNAFFNSNNQSISYGSEIHRMKTRDMISSVNS